MMFALSSGDALQPNLAQFHTGLENEGCCRSACLGTFRCRPQRPVDVNDPYPSISCLTWYLWQKIKGHYFALSIIHEDCQLLHVLGTISLHGRTRPRKYPCWRFRVGRPLSCMAVDLYDREGPHALLAISSTTRFRYQLSSPKAKRPIIETENTKNPLS